jgi:ABC-type uncharacterized transport system ATPase subunit
MRKMRCFLREKRGLNTLSLIIFLVTLVLLTVGIVYIWKTVQFNAGHSLQIASISLQPANMRIFVQNTGLGSMTIISVQIDGELFSVSAADCVVGSENTNILDESLTAEITINRVYQGPIHVRVTCEDGTFNELDYKPP